MPGGEIRIRWRIWRKGNGERGEATREVSEGPTSTILPQEKAVILL